MKLDELPSVALTLVLIGAIFVAGFLVLGGLSKSLTNDASASYNASISAVNNLTSGMTNVVTYAPTWGTIIGVAVLLGIVIFGFMYIRGHQQGGV